MKDILQWASPFPKTLTILLAIGQATPAQDWEASGGFWPGTGAAIALGDVDLDGYQDTVLVCTEDVGTAGINGQRIIYMFGSYTGPDGAPLNLHDPLHPPTYHWLDRAFRFTTNEKPGTGAALVQLDGDPRLELVVAMVYPKAGAYELEWRIAFNLAADGTPSSWSAEQRMPLPATTQRTEGAGIAFADLGGDARPDAIVMVYADNGPANDHVYCALRDWDATGPHAQGPWLVVPGQGHIAEGADVALVQLDENPRPELVFMSYDAPAGDNGFRWKIGWNVNQNGTTIAWADRREEVFVGHTVGQGAGMALAQLDGDPRLDLVFMAYEDGLGSRRFAAHGARNALGAVVDRGTGCMLNSVQPRLAPALCAIPTACDPFPLVSRNALNFGLFAGLVVSFDLTDPGFDLAPMFPGCTLMVLPVSGALNIPFGIEPVSTIPGMCGLDTLFAQAYYIDPGTFDLGLSQPIEILFGRL
ncbi:MAG: hypothetical protein KDC98_21220 [Planctomycetes bacterium]|nr:hypothetical protein [Planctomycetota bacterium]